MTRATPNGTTGLQYVDLPAYIAASPDQQMFIELTPEMIEPCRSPKSMICPISRAVSRKSSKGMCSVAIFLADDRRVQDSCDIIVTPWSGQDAVYLGHRRWGLSVINTTRLTFTCPKAADGPKSYIVDTPAISVFQVPMSCTAQSDDWIFQASFKKDIHSGWITRNAPLLSVLEPLQPPVRGEPHDDLGAHRQVVSQPARNAASSQHTIHVQATDMFHQMQGLSDLEHTRIRDQDTTNRSRYPWEWIVGFILFISVAGFLVKTTHSQYASQHHVLAVQMSTLEERIQQHEDEVSDTP